MDEIFTLELISHKYNFKITLTDNNGSLHSHLMNDDAIRCINRLQGVLCALWIYDSQGTIDILIDKMSHESTWHYETYESNEYKILIKDALIKYCGNVIEDNTFHNYLTEMLKGDHDFTRGFVSIMTYINNRDLCKIISL